MEETSRMKLREAFSAVPSFYKDDIKRELKSKKRWLGQCFECAVMYMISHFDDHKKMTLVNGQVTMLGPSGMRINHGWVEIGKGWNAKIVDLTIPEQYQKSLNKLAYYVLMGVDEKKTLRYDPAQVKMMVNRKKHYGNWETIPRSNHFTGLKKQTGYDKALKLARRIWEEFNTPTPEGV